MAQVRIALGAADFGAHHAVAHILEGADGLGVHPFPEAGPAGAGVEFAVRAEQLSAAADAAVGAIAFVIPIGTGEGPLGAALAGHAELLGSQLGAPVVLACFHGVINGSAQR